MHDPAGQHEYVTFDFGVTRLGASFHQDWSSNADTPLDHVRNLYGPDGDPGFVLPIVEDILRLRASSLDGQDLHLLWSATGDGTPWIQGRERAWLDELLSAVIPLAQARGASPVSYTTYPVCAPGGAGAAAADHWQLAAEVVDLVGLLDHVQPWAHTPLEQTRKSLVRCAELVCSELAFRFLVNASHQFCSRLSLDTYGRLERLSAAFGHGPHLVDAVEYLTD